MAAEDDTGEGRPATRATLPFAKLLFALRGAGLKVGLSEWMTLMEAFARGAIQPSLEDFYAIGRSLVVKDVTYFDLWDQCFEAVFADGALPVAEVEKVLDWLAEAKKFAELHPEFTEEDAAKLEALPLEELRRQFEERLAEQDARHDGGNRWVGTGGTSPFGHSGRNPAGVRVGGPGGGRSAVQVASMRRFRAYRDDVVLDTRQIAMALRKLRRLSRHEGEPELDLDGTVDATGRNAGELEIVMQPPRENQARVLLGMDVGGSMDPYAALVDKLFSAASGLNHWKKLTPFTFHNCPYERVYPREWGHDGTATGDLLREHPRETFLVMVGDASMAPSELLDVGGAVEYWHRNDTPGYVWLHRLRKRFDRAVWLNPMPRRWWRGYTVELIGGLYPMFPLTLRGLQDAVDHLLKRRAAPVPPIDPRLTRGWQHRPART